MEKQEAIDCAVRRHLPYVVSTVNGHYFPVEKISFANGFFDYLTDENTGLTRLACSYHEILYIFSVNADSWTMKNDPPMQKILNSWKKRNV